MRGLIVDSIAPVRAACTGPSITALRKLKRISPLPSCRTAYPMSKYRDCHPP